MAAMLNCAIFDSAILNKKNTWLIPAHSTWWCEASWILPYWIEPFWTKKNFIHSFWLILMLAAILNSTILESAILKKKLHSFILTPLDDGSHLEFCHLGFRLLPSWIQTPCYLLSDSLKNTLTPIWLWLKLIQSDSNSFILTQLDDGSHLKFLPSWILPSWIQKPSSVIFSQTHLHTCQAILNSHHLGISHFGKNTSLIHSDSTWWWQPSWILPSWIQLLPCWIQTPCYLLLDSLKNTLTALWLWLKLIQSD